MTIQAGYSITKTALKALTAGQRIDKYARHVDLGNGKHYWFTFVSASDATPDNISIIMPDDNPATGRWIADDGAAEAYYGGEMACSNDCPTDRNNLYYSGKAFKFYCPQNIRIIIKPTFGMTITPGSTSIQLFRWSQSPNTYTDGREFVAEMPHTGGSTFLEIDSGHRWISIFAKNPSNVSVDLESGFDAACFVMNGNVATLLSF
jgi:hypothetical protein